MTSQAGTPAAIRWLPWTRVAFDRAREEGKPVILSVVAGWSRACSDMDVSCYADAEVASEINRWFIPVRVDADRRPDIADRYDLGGLPTTAFLDADAGILGGGTFVPRARLLAALRQVRASTSARESPRVAAIGARAADDPAATDLGAVIWASFDPDHGGFGSTPKFPLVAPVALALDEYRESGSATMAEYATRTLDAMGWGALFDADSGGFYRCAARADWTEPEPGRLLSLNAALVDLYLNAGATLENQRWLARAADVVSFVDAVLRVRGADGWRASDLSDNTRLTDGNAAMVRACLHASRAFGDRTLGEHALGTLESVLLATYRPGHGVAHCEGGVRGLLTDHVAMIHAQLDAFEATGNVVYQMMAEELAHQIVRTMADEDPGGFFDRAGGDEDEVGLLEQRMKPFVLNCDAAVAFDRLGRAGGDTTFRLLAGRALDAVAHEAVNHGPLAAHFVLARRALAR